MTSGSIVIGKAKTPRPLVNTSPEVVKVDLNVERG
jgi:hypothetical protein